MTFRTLGLGVTLSAAALGATAAAGQRNLNMTTRGEQGVRSCADLDIRYGDGVTARGEEQLSVRRADAPRLQVTAPHHGGIYVTGSKRDDYAITVCKAAWGRRDEDAQALLRQVTPSVTGGGLQVRGPAISGDDTPPWMAYLIIHAPADAALDLETHNGPLGLRELTGQVSATTHNGPLSIEACAGNLEGRTQNGPISVSGHSGNLRLRAQNGPVSIDLQETRWSGTGLDASTQNGPLSLKLPARYVSGVRVEMSGHSPFRCRARGCAEAMKDWDTNTRSLQFNGAPTLVRASTVNGPVSIEDR